MSSKIIELKIQIEHFTNKAILVKNLNDNKVWIPKSQIELDDEELSIGQIQEIQIPEWIAVDKELV
jgi:hypothetical protein